MFITPASEQSSSNCGEHRFVDVAAFWYVALTAVQRNINRFGILSGFPKNKNMVAEFKGVEWMGTGAVVCHDKK